MGVFKIDKDFKVILNPEAVKLVPELVGLTSDELLYIVCVIDYDDGPFRKKPLDERRLLASRKYFSGKKPELIETAKIKRGMDSYKELIFDIRRETIDKYKRRILLLQKESLKEEIEIKRLKDIDAAITFLTDRVNKIQHELDIEEQSDNVKIQGGRKLSQIEKLVYSHIQILF